EIRRGYGDSRIGRVAVGVREGNALITLRHGGLEARAAAKVALITKASSELVARASARYMGTTSPQPER
ncbi:MAG: hypothetical protein KAJ42_15975, partial [Gemmatimonadetes bacterium]|nr:hypothetical protein [Gemmatimonadota bacterium]